VRDAWACGGGASGEGYVFRVRELRGSAPVRVGTRSEAQDCPVARRLLRRVKPSKYALGDNAYDSNEKQQ
jgi:hypothetical protein